MTDVTITGACERHSDGSAGALREQTPARLAEPALSLAG